MILDGRYASAAESFSTLVRLSREQAELQNSNAGATEAFLDQCMAQSKPVLRFTGSLKQEGKGYNVYDRPIFVPLSLQESSCRRGQASMILSIAVLFNLSLCYHFHGMETRSSTCLRKAARLYGLALNLQQQLHLESGLLVLACVNNIALIHNELNDTVAASSCFQHLMSGLMCIVAGEGSCSSSSWLSPEDFDGFLRNASQSLHSQHNPAAAA